MDKTQQLKNEQNALEEELSEGSISTGEYKEQMWSLEREIADRARERMQVAIETANYDAEEND